jgi:dihydrofolate reductase
MNLIVAHDQHNIIGYDNTIPWKISEDLRRFRELTMNNIVIMGRKTYLSIGHPLKDRINIIITREPEKYKTLNSLSNVIYIQMNDLDSTLNDLYEKDDNKDKKIFVIGGSEIYNSLIDYCDTMYITEIIRPYSNPNFIDTEKYSYFYYDKSKWTQTYISKDYVSNSDSKILYNYLIYTRK